MEYLRESHRHTNPPTPGSRTAKEPRKERCPHPATFRKYLLAFPVKETPPQAPSTEPLHREREAVHPPSPFSHLKVSSRRTLPPGSPKVGPYEKRCPSLEPFLHILKGPQQGRPHSRFLSQSSHRVRRSTPRAPFNSLGSLIGVPHKEVLHH